MPRRWSFNEPTRLRISDLTCPPKLVHKGSHVTRAAIADTASPARVLRAATRVGSAACALTCVLRARVKQKRKLEHGIFPRFGR